jgi:hypothetical protein
MIVAQVELAMRKVRAERRQYKRDGLGAKSFSILQNLCPHSCNVPASVCTHHSCNATAFITAAAYAASTVLSASDSASSLRPDCINLVNLLAGRILTSTAISAFIDPTTIPMPSSPYHSLSPRPQTLALQS